MNNIQTLISDAHTVADRAVAAIPNDAWENPSPCAEWTVRELLGHLAHEEAWVPPLLDGMTIEAVGDRFERDLLGDDPRVAWSRLGEQALAAWTEVPMDRTVHLSIGDFPASEYAMQMLSEYLVHGWDLAVSLGAPADLPHHLIEACGGWFDRWEHLYREDDAIETTDVPPGADAQTRLLARFGRTSPLPT